ncbi:hypothetical protein OIU76_026955 [Salix suchowensis]|nr:hypothetical protein OIU76_026955 [Salix suchowensis]
MIVVFHFISEKKKKASLSLQSHPLHFLSLNISGCWFDFCSFWKKTFSKVQMVLRLKSTSGSDLTDNELFKSGFPCCWKLKHLENRARHI